MGLKLGQLVQWATSKGCIVDHDTDGSESLTQTLKGGQLRVASTCDLKSNDELMYSRAQQLCEQLELDFREFCVWVTDSQDSHASQGGSSDLYGTKTTI